MKYIALLGLVAAVSAQSVSIPSPSASCVPGTAFCAGDFTNIILRCDTGFIQPGNCNDNTGEPTQGALCNSYAPSQASCSIIGSSSTISVPIVTGTGTGSGTTGTPIPPAGNSTLSVTNTPTASSTGSGPVSTGGAAEHGVALFGVVAAAVLGVAAAL